MKQYGYQTAPKDPARQYQGKVNRARGERFEAEINQACKYYADKGIAAISKTPEPMRVIRPLSDGAEGAGKGRFIAHFDTKAQPDYKGVLQGGQAVMFEAKYTATGEMKKNRISEGQSASLDEFASMGAICFVLAGFEQEGYYRIPWGVWRLMEDIFGRKYVKPGELLEYKVPCVRGVVLILEGLGVSG